jgi:hypothetical protein
VLPCHCALPLWERQPRYCLLTRVAYCPRLQMVLHSLDPSSSQYNQPLPLSLHGEVDLELLHRSLLAIMARHQPLRTVYRQAADGAGWTPTTFTPSGECAVQRLPTGRPVVIEPPHHSSPPQRPSSR